MEALAIAQDVPIVRTSTDGAIAITTTTRPHATDDKERPVHWLAGPTEALVSQPFTRVASYTPHSAGVGGSSETPFHKASVKTSPK